MVWIRSGGKESYFSKTGCFWQKGDLLREGEENDGTKKTPKKKNPEKQTTKQPTQPHKKKKPLKKKTPKTVQKIVDEVVALQCRSGDRKPHILHEVRLGSKKKRGGGTGEHLSTRTAAVSRGDRKGDKTYKGKKKNQLKQRAKKCSTG